MEEEYVVSDCELEIASYLFGRRTYLFQNDSGNGVTEPVSFGTASEDELPVFIYKEKDQFSRCVCLPSEKDNLQQSIGF